jgi:hypothetical protein
MTEITNAKDLLSTLNEHQLAYVNLDLANPYNGDYMLASFYLEP